MLQASVVVDRDFRLAEIDSRLYGGFIEHLGRHIYTGIYEPDHPLADQDGFRSDVMDMVRELAMPVIRYPGGNFVSGYNWEDGIGPVGERPARLDLAWKTLESNRFGLHEFMNWCGKAGSQAMLAVNLGTRGVDAARNLVEYCNHPGGTYWSDLRKKNGAAEPFAVRLWCLGNEMDGPWQIAAKPAAEYGALARETAKVMKWIDPGIRVVLCGSSNNQMPTFGSWELEALDQAYEHIDYLSLHHYFKNLDGDSAAYLAQPEAMYDYIRGAAACCDAIAAKKRQKRKVSLSFDEWNVWTHTMSADRELDPWREAPRLLEEAYTFEDALVVGGMLIALVNSSDRVRMACLAQVVNVLAPIMAEPGGPCWAQTTFYPFADVSKHGRGEALKAVVDSPLHDAGSLSDVPYLAAAITASPEGDGMSAFLLNRHLTENVEASLDLRSFSANGAYEWTSLSGHDLKAANTMTSPRNVVPDMRPGGRIAGGKLKLELPAASWNCISVRWEK